MSLEKFIEDQISKAMARGEFDNLPGRGKPLDLDWYFRLPEDLRLAYSMLKEGNFVPEEAQLLKEIQELKQQLDGCSDEEKRKQITKSINEKRLSFDLLLERLKRGK
jgi:hypothetical protein